MKTTLVVLTLALFALVGISGAVLNLSGTDFNKAFSNPSMKDDGVGITQLGAETWSTPSGWNDASDGKPVVEGRKILSIGLVNYDRIGIQKTKDILIVASNEISNETLNTTINKTEAI